MISWKSFLHLDFLAAIGAAGYGLAVAWPGSPLAFLTEHVAQAGAAFAFAGLALGRWALSLRGTVV